MQARVMLRVCRFVTQQVAVRARVIKALIAAARLFADRQGDGAVGVTLPDRRDDLTNAVVGIIRILAALQDKGAISQRVALGTAGKDLIPAQPIALDASVLCAQTTVTAVVFAVIGELDQPAQKNSVAVALTAHGVGGSAQLSVITIAVDQLTQGAVAEITGIF